MNKEIPGWKFFVGAILAFVTMFASQIASQIGAAGFDFLGAPDVVVNIVEAILYPLFTFLGLKLLIDKMLKVRLKELRFSRVKLSIPGVIIAILLPTIVIVTYMFTSGEWVELEATSSEKAVIIFTGILHHSLAAAMVEEMVFRGIIMGLLEKWSNIKVAVILPSIIFGAIHIANGAISPMSAVLLVVGGTAVGILFSLLCYHFDNLWNNILVHACWNATTFGVMHIGLEQEKNAVYTYVLKMKSMLLTGGDYGIDASIISVSAYIVFIIVLIVLIKNKKTNGEKDV